MPSHISPVNECVEVEYKEFFFIVIDQLLFGAVSYESLKKIYLFIYLFLLLLNTAGLIDSFLMKA